jgi:hypothetical protein
VNCIHCQRRIVEGPNGWYHASTEADRCRDDASFTYAEPRNPYPDSTPMADVLADIETNAPHLL